MNGPMPPTEELKKIDTKTELVRAKINLHNIRFQVEVQEAIVKGLELMSH